MKTRAAESNCEYMFKILDKDIWYKSVKDPNFTFHGDGTAVILTQIATPTDSEIEELYDRGAADFYFWKRDGNYKIRHLTSALDPSRIEEILNANDNACERNGISREDGLYKIKINKLKHALTEQVDVFKLYKVAEYQELRDRLDYILKCYDNKTLDYEQTFKELLRFAAHIQEVADHTKVDISIER